jgi:hypothetical protein
VLVGEKQAQITGQRLQKQKTVGVHLRVVGIVSLVQQLKERVGSMDLPLLLPYFFRFAVGVGDDEGNGAGVKKKQHT